MMRKALWRAAPSVAAEAGCTVCSCYCGGSGSRELGLDIGLVQNLQDLLPNDPVLQLIPTSQRSYYLTKQCHLLGT